MIRVINFGIPIILSSQTRHPAHTYDMVNWIFVLIKWFWLIHFRKRKAFNRAMAHSVRLEDLIPIHRACHVPRVDDHFRLIPLLRHPEIDDYENAIWTNFMLQTRTHTQTPNRWKQWKCQTFWLLWINLPFTNCYSDGIHSLTFAYKFIHVKIFCIVHIIMFTFMTNGSGNSQPGRQTKVRLQTKAVHSGDFEEQSPYQMYGIDDSEHETWEMSCRCRCRRHRRRSTTTHHTNI